MLHSSSFTFYRINRQGDHIIERTALPDELIAHVQGSIAYQDTKPRVHNDSTSHVHIDESVTFK